MSNETETPIPAPSPGLIARLAAAISNSAPAPDADTAFNALKSSFDALQADHSALTEAATAAAVKLEEGKAEIEKLSADIDGLQAKLFALNAVVPGISSASDPAAVITQAITLKATEQIAAMGLPPGDAPSNDPKPSANDQKTMALSDFQKLPVAEANAFMRDGGKLTE